MSMNHSTAHYQYTSMSDYARALASYPNKLSETITLTAFSAQFLQYTTLKDVANLIAAFTF